MTELEKRYIGDGVYVRPAGYGSFVLTTENGYRATNEITIEREVWVELVRFVERMKESGL